MCRSFYRILVIKFCVFSSKNTRLLRRCYSIKEGDTKDEGTRNDEPGTGLWHQQTE